MAPERAVTTKLFGHGARPRSLGRPTARDTSAAHALRDTARTHALAAALDVVWLVVDAQGEVVTPQPSWHAYTGQRFEDARELGIAQAIHTDDRPRFTAAWNRALRDGRPFSLEVRVFCSSAGEARVRIFRAEPIEDASGHVLEWMCVLDRTAERTEPAPAQEGALVRLDDRRMDALRALARGIAHQLNNLMHGVMVHAELINRHVAKESPAHASVEHVLRATERGAEFGRQLLAFAGRNPSSSSRTKLESSIAPLAPVLTSLCPVGTRLALALEDTREPVDADDERLRHVLLSLVQNAAEALQARGGTITVRTGHQSFASSDLIGAEPAAHVAPGHYAYVDVEDDGPGISPEIRARIFEPFFANKFTGRGLGLPVVLGIVRAWGGLVDLRSQPGRGTRVRILLPVRSP